MKNFLHAIALYSFFIWIAGYISFDLGGKFHFVLVASLIATLGRFLIEKSTVDKPQKSKNLKF